MMVMAIKYKVTLTKEEREELQSIVKAGKTQGYKIRHAQILLALDDVSENEHWTDLLISKAYHVTEKTVGNIRKRFVEQGFTSALGRQKRETPPSMIKIDGEVEAKLIVLATSEAPEGRSRWTLQLLANKLVEEGVVESISATAVGTTLKKMNLSLG
jgi:transposase